jgi:hypothetical protein
MPVAQADPQLVIQITQSLAPRPGPLGKDAVTRRRDEMHCLSRRGLIDKTSGDSEMPLSQ